VYQQAAETNTNRDRLIGLMLDLGEYCSLQFSELNCSEVLQFMGLLVCFLGIQNPVTILDDLSDTSVEVACFCATQLAFKKKIVLNKSPGRSSNSLVVLLISRTMELVTKHLN